MLPGFPCHWMKQFKLLMTLLAGMEKFTKMPQAVVADIIQHVQQPECLTIPDGCPPRRPRTSRLAISSFWSLNSRLHRKHVTDIKYATGQRTADSVSRHHFLGQISTLGRPHHFFQRQPSAILLTGSTQPRSFSTTGSRL